jgi:two-component system, OmpR family, alkaline phosphatase synthesis response regulator PhoP
MTARLLIVDDEYHIRLLIEQALEPLVDLGAELFLAENGVDALQIIESAQPDLVFLDAMMPRMNGFDVCRAVKHDLGLARTYIVLLTAKGQEFDRRQGEQAGADVYMTKPFDPDALLELATGVIQGLT